MFTSSLFPVRSFRPSCGPTLARVLALGAVAAAMQAAAQSNPAGIDWQAIAGSAPASGAGTARPAATGPTVPAFQIARTETTVGQFRRFARATQFVSKAEREGGGLVYESGWVQKPGWTWQTPFGGGKAAADAEPAVHLSFEEAQAFCRWAGGALPTDAQWVSAAYTEQRPSPAAGFERGKVYPYPSGEQVQGAQCLGDCGPQAQARAIRHGAALVRGHGHALAGSTPAGVNGLFEMGANAWEWVDEPLGASGNDPRRTRGGSWWYGQSQMRVDALQSKPADTTVVYIGFRCVRGP